MQLAMIGLGRMGGNMAERLRLGGHAVHGYDAMPAAREAARERGLEVADTLEDTIGALPTPRVVWLMVPAGEIVEQTIASLQPLLSAGDIVIDGGNSFYQDSMRRAQALGEAGIHFVDCGTSGGVWGLREGYSLMIGGDAAATDALRPVFETLAPSPDSGWGRVGPSGSGHFTKMVHNGIEYGLMQAYAEGFAIMQRKQDFALDLAQVAQIWRSGSVVRSWLLDLTADALREEPSLESIAPHVADSGEGRWTVAEAIALDVPAPVITQSLIARLRSRDEEAFGDRLLAALRNQFGGHAVKPSEG